MAQPRVIILRAPGTNCDRETAFAFEQAGAVTRSLHVNRLLEQTSALDTSQILCIPGGFSYGDDIAAGRILGNQLRHHLTGAIRKFKDDNKLILGICNGFQVLIKSGILLDDSAADSGDDQPSSDRGAATLAWNDSGKFEDRWVDLRVSGGRSVFLRGIESLYLPVAHAEGKFVARDEATLSHLDDAGQLVLRYAARDDGPDDDGPDGADGDTLPFPENPNGSMRNTAGVCDATGRVLGLMPHPERFIDPTHHPRWTRGEAPPVGDGLRLFQNAVSYFSD